MTECFHCRYFFAHKYPKWSLQVTMTEMILFRCSMLLFYLFISCPFLESRLQPDSSTLHHDVSEATSPGIRMFSDIPDDELYWKQDGFLFQKSWCGDVNLPTSAECVQQTSTCSHSPPQSKVTISNLMKPLKSTNLSTFCLLREFVAKCVVIYA